MEGVAGARHREEWVVEGNEEAKKQGSGTGQMGAEQTLLSFSVASLHSCKGKGNKRAFAGLLPNQSRGYGNG